MPSEEWIIIQQEHDVLYQAGWRVHESIRIRMKAKKSILKRYLLDLPDFNINQLNY